VTLTKFVITGDNGDEVRAKLKAHLDAQDAGFKASLNAMFKPAPVPAAAVAPVAKPPAARWSALGTNRDRRFVR
jgi:hypothetical protein